MPDLVMFGSHGIWPWPDAELQAHEHMTAVHLGELLHYNTAVNVWGED